MFKETTGAKPQWIWTKFYQKYYGSERNT